MICHDFPVDLFLQFFQLIKCQSRDILACSLVLTSPFPPGRLDVTKMDVLGGERWVVPTKSTVIEPEGVSASFFLWIFDGGQWKVFFPASLEDIDP